MLASSPGVSLKPEQQSPGVTWTPKPWWFLCCSQEDFEEMSGRNQAGIYFCKLKALLSTGWFPLPSPNLFSSLLLWQLSPFLPPWALPRAGSCSWGTTRIGDNSWEAGKDPEGDRRCQGRGTGQRETAPSCAKVGYGENSFPKRLSSPGPAAQDSGGVPMAGGI